MAAYFARQLDDLDMHGQEVQVGYDIHDGGRVWVRDGDGRFLCIAERDAHASAYFPKSQIERAQEKRTRERTARLARHLAEVEAELGGAPSLIEAAQLTPEQEERAAEQLAALSPPQARSNQSARPVFADDLSWVSWLTANPDAATMEDRMHLEAALRQPSFRQLLEFSGVDRQALSRLTSAAIRQIA